MLSALRRAHTTPTHKPNPQLRDRVTTNYWRSGRHSYRYVTEKITNTAGPHPAAPSPHVRAVILAGAPSKLCLGGFVPLRLPNAHSNRPHRPQPRHRSEGHGFSRAINTTGSQTRTALPKAGVQAQPERPICPLPSRPAAPVVRSTFSLDRSETAPPPKPSTYNVERTTYHPAPLIGAIGVNRW